jgi:hypothetical protein
MAREKFCLRWNDFKTNISLAFRELRDDKDFFDVTLACGDEQIQAHKMILSACSPFFRNILRRNPHQHPLLYLKGVKYTDLQSVLNFMYHGEVNVAQEELNSFLAVAEDLRVKGLTQNQAEPSNVQTTNQSQAKSVTLPKPNHRPPVKDRIPPPKHSHSAISALPPPATSSAHFPSLSQGMDNELQEVVPVKTEPRDLPPARTPTTPLLPHAQDIYTPESHSLAPVEDDSYVYQDDQYAEYDQYQADLAPGASVLDQADYAATEDHSGTVVFITFLRQ